MPYVRRKARELGVGYQVWSGLNKRTPNWITKYNFKTMQNRMVRLVTILKAQKARQRAKLVAKERAMAKKLFSQPGAFKFRPKWRGVKRKRGYLSARYPKKRPFRARRK